MPLYAGSDSAIPWENQRPVAGPHRHPCRSARGSYQELRGNTASETSAEIRTRIERTRAVQQARGYYNARMPVRMIRKQCALDDSGERTLEMAVRRMGLSARAHDRILKVARTIADLAGSETVAAKHVAEAVQYRSLDRNYWN